MILLRVCFEVATGDEFHRVVDATIGQRSDVMNRNNTRVFESGENLGFSDHARLQVVIGVRRANDLERCVAF